jgi:hypothetical protein
MAHNALKVRDIDFVTIEYLYLFLLWKRLCWKVEAVQVDTSLLHCMFPRQLL